MTAKTDSKSRPWLFFTMLAAAATFFFWGWLEYREKANAWNDAIRQHGTCQELVRQVERLKTVPKFAVLNADSPQAISARIETTARATLPPGALVSIQPESGRRVGNTSYLLNPTLVQLQDVTLLELASFASGLEDAGQGLVVSEVRLLESQPAAGSEPERWTGDLKLTQTIYSANVSRQ